MSEFTCYEEVVRYGFAEPCDLPATGYATHPECERPYPACEHHRDKTSGRHTAALTYLLARRPELRDVGIAGYLVGAAVEGVPGMPRGPFACDCGCEVMEGRWAA